MIYIITDSYDGLKHYIKRYGLKKNAAFKHFNMFEGGSFYAVAAGEEALAAAIGLTKLCENFPPCKNDLLICIKGAENGRIMLANKITSAETGESFYPDMIYSSNFEEGEILSQGFEIGVFTAASYYFSKGNMVFVKGCETDKFCLWLEALGENLNKATEEMAKYAVNGSLLKQVEEKLHLTEYMKSELKQLAKYAALTGIDAEKILAEFTEIEITGKKEGKKYFNELKDELFKQTL